LTTASRRKVSIPVNRVEPGEVSDWGGGGGGEQAAPIRGHYREGRVGSRGAKVGRKDCAFSEKEKKTKALTPSGGKKGKTGFTLLRGRV